jgi:hypothetical protein
LYFIELHNIKSIFIALYEFNFENFIRKLFVLGGAELLSIFRSFVFELVVGKINDIILMGKLLGVMIELGKLMELSESDVRFFTRLKIQALLLISQMKAKNKLQFMRIPSSKYR